jgi:hypothetical protein
VHRPPFHLPLAAAGIIPAYCFFSLVSNWMKREPPSTHPGPGSEECLVEVGGFFCGYLTDEAWQWETEDS